MAPARRGGTVLEVVLQPAAAERQEESDDYLGSPRRRP